MSCQSVACICREVLYRSFENAKSDIPVRKHEGKYLKSDETKRKKRVQLKKIYRRHDSLSYARMRPIHGANIPNKTCCCRAVVVNFKRKNERILMY